MKPITLLNLIHSTKNPKIISIFEEEIGKLFNETTTPEERKYGDREELVERTIQLFIWINQNYNQPYFCVDPSTGEILLELDLRNGEEEEESDDSSHHISQEPQQEASFSMHAPAYTKKTQVYRRNGVIIHRPDGESCWDTQHNFVTIRVKTSSGRTVHEFYGGENDFTEWFLAMVTKNQKFNLFGFERGKEVKVTEMYLIFANNRFLFWQNEDYGWDLKLRRPANSSYFEWKDEVEKLYA